MNNLAVVIGALVAAAQADQAYAVTSTTIKVIREAVPTGCVGYSLVEVENLDRLKAVVNQCTNDKNQKFFGLKVIPSNDLRYDDSILVYCTKSMAKKWKTGKTEVPGTLSPYLSSDNENTDGLAS